MRAQATQHLSTTSRDQRRLELALAAARTAAENRGRDIVVLDLRRQTAICDFFVIATGSSRRQLHAMCDEIERVLEREMGCQRLGIEGYDGSHWLLVDFGEVVVHLFDDETRDYYQLEKLWCDAQRVPFEPPPAVAIA